jgi:hypothetical protein
MARTGDGVCDGDGVGWRLCGVEPFNPAIATARRTHGSRYGQLVSKDKEEKQRGMLRDLKHRHCWEGRPV